MHFSIDRTVHTTAFDKPVVDHWLERNWVNLTCVCKAKFDDLAVVERMMIWCSRENDEGFGARMMNRW